MLLLTVLTGSFQYLIATGGAGRLAHIGSSPESIAFVCASVCVSVCVCGKVDGAYQLFHVTE